MTKPVIKLLQRPNEILNGRNLTTYYPDGRRIDHYNPHSRWFGDDPYYDLYERKN